MFTHPDGFTSEVKETPLPRAALSLLGALLRVCFLTDCPPSSLHGCSTHPNLQLDPLVMSIDCLDLEVDAHCAHKSRGEGVVGIAEQEGGLAHTAIPDQEQFEHVVKVLVGSIPWAGRGLTSRRHRGGIGLEGRPEILI